MTRVKDDVSIRMLHMQIEPVAKFYKRLWGGIVDYVTFGVDGGMTVISAIFCFISRNVECQ